jgi:hypothetical protein
VGFYVSGFLGTGTIKAVFQVCGKLPSERHLVAIICKHGAMTKAHFFSTRAGTSSTPTALLIGRLEIF